MIVVCRGIATARQARVVLNSKDDEHLPLRCRPMVMHEPRRCSRCVADLATYGETLIDRSNGTHLDVDKIARKTELTLEDIATDEQIDEVTSRAQRALDERRGEVTLTYFDLPTGAEILALRDDGHGAQGDSGRP